MREAHDVVGAALVWEDGKLVAVVSSRPDARAYRVERDVSGAAVETALPARYLARWCANSSPCSRRWAGCR